MRHSEMTALDRVVRRSLKDFLGYVKAKGWTGRENEGVSDYAFGFLQRECTPGALLKDPTQIGIDVGAAAATNNGASSQTRKDLVIWRQPGASRRFPRRRRSEPLAIMVWKVWRPWFRSGSSNANDKTCLANHCTCHPRTVGYAVWLVLRTRPPQVYVHRIDCNGVKELPL